MNAPYFVIEESIPPKGGETDMTFKVLWKKFHKDATYFDAVSEFENLIKHTRNKVELWYSSQEKVTKLLWTRNS